MPTIRELAEYTNTSIATVSNVLNEKAGVKEATRQKILAAAQELGYRPNLNARNLRSGRSQTIGIISEDLTVFNAPEIIDGIAAACDEAGYHYILENLRFFKRFGNGARDEALCAELTDAAITDLLSRQADGIIYIGCHSHTIVPISGHPDSHLVCAYCTSSDPEVPSVTYDDENAAYRLTELLLRNGDTRIGMITGPMDSIHSVNRTIGYMRALYDAHTLYDPALTLVGDWERDCGYELAGQLLRAGVTAIFSHNDIMAMGVLDYCTSNGIHVGQDIRLAGFDNRQISSVCRPALTTVALPLFEIGQTAMEEMIHLLSEGQPRNHQTLLDCTIVERDSTQKTEDQS